MEDIENQLVSTGLTLSTHPDFRMSVPPRVEPFQDLGATNWDRQTRSTMKRHKKDTVLELQESDDELDTLRSSPSRNGRSRLNIPSRKKQDVVEAQDTRHSKDIPSRVLPKRIPEKFPLSLSDREDDAQSDRSLSRFVGKASTRKPSEFPCPPSSSTQ
jgi:hypothetical protein